MFSKKIAWLGLFAILPLSLHALASEPLPDTQILIDRAYYWAKLGRADMAVQSWQTLLQIEPENTEARAAIALYQVKNDKQPEANNDLPVLQKTGSAQVEISNPVIRNTLVPAQLSEPVSAPIPEPIAAWILAPLAAPLPEAVPVLLAEPVPAKIPELVSVPVGVPAQIRATIPAKIQPEVKLQQTQKWNEFSLRDLNIATPEVELKEMSGQGGSLQPNNKPTKQELLDRATYWDKRGRSDVADKIRKNLPAEVSKPLAVQADKPVPGVVIPVISERSKPTVTTITPVVMPDERAEVAQVTPEKPSPQVVLDRAKYWDDRGRSDLADNARNQLHPNSVASKPVVLRVVQIEPNNYVEPQAAANVKPSAQQLNDNAQYWDAHGRSDLAEQIRQKLQSFETVPLSNARLRTNGNSQRAENIEKNLNNQDVAESLLENSLLKNPGNMKTRLDLAQVYRGAGEIAKARVQIESILAVTPDLPEALYASAQLYSEQRLWLETLHALEKVSPVSRTDEMGKLQKTAWAHVQIDRADALVRQGNNSEAEVLLRRVAAELAINYNQTVQPEPPPLWKNETQKRKKN
jgi:tetratricopeptide (TPR) repeat protein